MANHVTSGNLESWKATTPNKGGIKQANLRKFLFFLYATSDSARPAIFFVDAGRGD